MGSRRKLGDWLSHYIEYTRETESAALFHKWVGISTLASALQRKVWFNFGRLKVYPNLFIILVSEPGIARKTQAIGFGEDLMTEVANIRIAADCTTPQALMDDLQHAECFHDFPSGERIKHNSLSIVSGEFEAFLGTKNNNQLMVITLTDFFDCKARPFKKRTRHSGDSVIDAVWLNMLGATTPESIAQCLPSSAIGGGLTSRIIYVWAEGKEKKVDVPEDNHELQELRQLLIHDLSLISLSAGGYNFAPSGREWWRNWYNNFDEKSKDRYCRDPAFNGWYSRKPAFILKLVQIISASEGDNWNIEDATFERALKTLEQAEFLMARTFNAVGRSQITADVDLIYNVVKQHKQISEKSLMSIVWRDMDARKFDNVANTAVRSGLIRRIYVKPPGSADPVIWYAWGGKKEGTCQKNA